MANPLMQDANDCDPIACWPKLDDMLLDIASAIAWSVRSAILGLLWRFRQTGAGCLDKGSMAQRLGQAPLLHCVIEEPIKVMLRSRTESILSHVVRPCAA